MWLGHEPGDVPSLLGSLDALETVLQLERFGVVPDSQTYIHNLWFAWEDHSKQSVELVWSLSTMISRRVSSKSSLLWMSSTLLAPWPTPLPCRRIFVDLLKRLATPCCLQCPLGAVMQRPSRILVCQYVVRIEQLVENGYSSEQNGASAVVEAVLQANASSSHTLGAGKLWSGCCTNMIWSITCKTYSLLQSMGIEVRSDSGATASLLSDIRVSSVSEGFLSTGWWQ